MGINASQLREFIISPVLAKFGAGWDNSRAVELLVLTAATESKGGTYLKQIRGCALGIYQMEPATYDDIWDNFLIGENYRMARLLLNACGLKDRPAAECMMHNLYFATGMARLHYLRVAAPLPEYHMPSIAQYYKQYWNTPKGANTADKALMDYKEYVKG